MLNNISIVLVEPLGDENIGMAARAMKNCGITDLRLVNPPDFKTKGAKKWACNALDVLEGAKTFFSLEKATSDTTLLVALSRREGKLRPPLLEHSKAASVILKRMKRGKVALIFGREDDGLDRSELDQCDLIWTIPTSKLYPSLNLAQAVMIAAHEVWRAVPSGPRNGLELFVPKSEIVPVLRQFSHALELLGYDDKDGGKLRRKIVREFERLFGRGGLFPKDLNMFLGLAARIEERAK